MISTMGTEIPPCPEALHGLHGEPNTRGNCPYCGLHLGRHSVGGRSRRSLSDEELDRTSWASREPVSRFEEQDPLYIDPGADDDPEPRRRYSEVIWSSQANVWPE